MINRIIFLLLAILAIGICSCRQNVKIEHAELLILEAQHINKPGELSYDLKRILKIDEFQKTAYNGQIGEYIRRIFQDHQGHLWFGTNSHGVARYNTKNLTYFNSENGMQCDQITGIIEDKNRNLWFSTNNGVFKYDGKHFAHFNTEHGLPDAYAWSIHEDRNGTIWVGTMKGLCRLINGHFMLFELPKSPVENPDSRFSPLLARTILEDSKGHFWFGMDGAGVCRYDGSTFTYLTRKDGLSDEHVVSIIEDQKGDIWFGTMFGGISKFDGENFEHFSVESGEIGNNEVWNIYEDKKGNIWFSSEGYGLYKYNGQTFEHFGEETGLKIKAVQTIFEDAQGRFWVGGGGGLYLMVGDYHFINVKQNGPWDNC